MKISDLRKYLDMLPDDAVVLVRVPTGDTLVEKAPSEVTVRIPRDVRKGTRIEEIHPTAYDVDRSGSIVIG